MTTGLVTGKGIQKSYTLGADSAHRVLHGVDVQIPPGTFCTILGPSGSGKSTLLRCLAGLEPVDAGSAQVSDVDVHQLSRREQSRFRQEDIAFVFQEYNLVSDLTMAENIGLDRPVREEVQGRVSAWGIEHVMDQFPAQCSGGQQQKVAILRALNKQSSVLFCDEPTGALDSASAADVLRVMHAVRDAGVTVVVITHNELMTEISDLVIRLHNGLVESTTPNHAPRSVDEVDW